MIKDINTKFTSKQRSKWKCSTADLSIQFLTKIVAKRLQWRSFSSAVAD